MKNGYWYINKYDQGENFDVLLVKYPGRLEAFDANYWDIILYGFTHNEVPEFYEVKDRSSLYRHIRNKNILIEYLGPL